MAGDLTAELVLQPEEIRQGIVDERRYRLQKKNNQECSQGILPFTNERLYEQSNPILRSALFTVGKFGARETYTDWKEIFSLGGGKILYRGPGLTVEHETVLAHILVLARGRSLTKPVMLLQSHILRWLGLDDSGLNFKKARLILDDLAAAELRIYNRPALERLLNLLTSPDIANLPDGKFFQELIKNRYSGHLKAIAEGLQNDEPVNITLRFITNQTNNPATGRMALSLDPIMAVFFDGVNTTLLPFEVYDALDRFGKKLLALVASHRDGMYSTKLESLHNFSGSKSDYQVVKRRFKSDMKKRLQAWEEMNYIQPGWKLEQNEYGHEMAYGLKMGDAIRTKSRLEVLPDVDFDYDGEHAIDHEL